MKLWLRVVIVFAIAVCAVLIAFNPWSEEAIPGQRDNQAMSASEDRDQPVVAERATASSERIPVRSSAINAVHGTQLPPENLGETIQRIQSVQRRTQQEDPVAIPQQAMPSLVDAVNATRPADDHSSSSINPFQAKHD